MGNCIRRYRIMSESITINLETTPVSIVINERALAPWGSAIGTLSAQTDLYSILSASNTWNDAYSYVVLNSGIEANQQDIVTLITNTSGNWNTSYTNLISNSAAYLSAVNLSFLSVSGNWNTAYQKVSSNNLYLNANTTSLTALNASLIVRSISAANYIGISQGAANRLDNGTVQVILSSNNLLHFPNGTNSNYALGGIGGWINLRGGAGSGDDLYVPQPGGNGGCIDLAGSDGGPDVGITGGIGGSIIMKGISTGGSAGSINTSSAYLANGGNIYTSATDFASGGNINTSSGAYNIARGGPGGSINTSGGAGSTYSGYFGKGGPGGSINLQGGEGSYFDGGSGGYISLIGGGGGDSVNAAGGAGGFIELNGAGGADGSGGGGGFIQANGNLHGGGAGYLKMNASYDTTAGSIDTSGGDTGIGTGGGNGGSIITRGCGFSAGGTIDTSGSDYGPGGYICTSSSGTYNIAGNLDTRLGIGNIFIDSYIIAAKGGTDVAGPNTGAWAGHINISGGFQGIDASMPAGNGGSLIMMGGSAGDNAHIGGTAGSINTSGSNADNNTHGLSGGSIDTSNGGGNIITRGCCGITGGYIDISAGTYSSYNNTPGGSGGYIDMRGGEGGAVGYGSGTGGSIIMRGGTSGGSASSGNGGSIIMNGTEGADAGFINTSSGGYQGFGGNIDTRGYGEDRTGGNIVTCADVYYSGGSINTSAGGGSINTTGSGYIQFGYDTQRTTLSGSATTNRTILLPDTSGTVVVAQARPIAYVEIDGDDTIAKVGNKGLSFATLSAAVVALSAYNGGTINIGVGTFSPPLPNSLYSNLDFIGAGTPAVNSTTPTGFLSGTGTIIKGSFSQGVGGNRLANMTFRGFGIDGVNTQSGSPDEGCFNFTHTTSASFVDFVVDDLIIVCPKGSSASHGLSLERMHRCSFNNIKVFYAYHGMAVKTTHCNFSNLHFGGGQNDSIIIKDGGIDCFDNNFTNINLFKLADNPTGPIIFDCSIPSNPIRNINFANVIGEGVSGGIQLAVGNSAVLNDIKFYGVSLRNGTGIALGFQNQGGGLFGDVTISDFTARNYVSGNSAILSINPEVASNARVNIIRPRAIGCSTGGFLFQGDSANRIDVVDPESSNNTYGYLFYNSGCINITGQLRGTGNTTQFAQQGGASGWWRPSRISAGGGAASPTTIPVAIATTVNTQCLSAGNNSNQVTSLLTTTIPPSLFNSLSGSTISVYSAGTFAANSNTKGLSAYFGGTWNGEASHTLIYDSTNQVHNGGAWILKSMITWVNNNLIKCSSEMRTTSGLYKAVQYQTLTGYQDANLEMSYYIYGKATSTNDITQEQMITNWLQSN
jgi:hypothetical protein